ncbi:hypothetical protein [Conexibacter woesei]|uniref:Collagen triple helix repeat protein n=1 Tax=Conexibacter woesei (strain DSM 14684 / CCUG 47730 / CIP 108061 / JCM 11494 / NBRC 100937 / ID131577) TaxID=469383 RepID=D3F7L1_CONWI|nr:hypothetical protein [Conexibacter woesei]ADB50873.1 hypothetical protein Cwoe_2450 [Conexibacter woesei DSM 14684]
MSGAAGTSGASGGAGAAGAAGTSGAAGASGTSGGAGAAGAAGTSGAAGASERAVRARPDQLAALGARPPARVTATFLARPRTEVARLLDQRTARACCALLLDPVGSLPFSGGKPLRWLLTAPLPTWPRDRFALELELCPLRGSPAPTLASYAVAGAPPFVLREQAPGGLVVELGGCVVETGIQLDYAQWQRIAVTWEEDARRLRLHKDDGPARVAAEGTGRTVAPLGPPLFEALLPGDAVVAAGGTLVVGQLQGRPGVLADLAAGRDFRGAVAEVRVWRTPPDFTAGSAREPAEDEPALFARWRFSALATALGEALATPSSPPALLGGFQADELRDVARLRAVGGDTRVAIATPPAIPADGREHTIELLLPAADADTRDAAPSLLLDGAALPSSPLGPADVLDAAHRGVRVGALDDLRALTLHAADGAEIARWDGSSDSVR